MDDENELSPVEKLVLMARQTEPGEEPETPALRMVSFRVQQTFSHRCKPLPL